MCGVGGARLGMGVAKHGVEELVLSMSFIFVFLVEK